MCKSNAKKENMVPYGFLIYIVTIKHRMVGWILDKLQLLIRFVLKIIAAAWKRFRKPESFQRNYPPKTKSKTFRNFTKYG